MLLVNPDRDEVVERLVELVGRALERIEPQRPDDIRPAVAQAVADGATVVAAVGGDGTQRTVASALIETTAAMAVIPGGTVNLLATALGLAELEDAADALTSGDHRSIDVARCNDQTFLLNASSGYDAEVIGRADDGLKQRFGRFGFVAAAFTEIRSLRSTRVVVEIDGDPSFNGPATTVIVTNVAQRSSADVLIAPAAEIDDGALHVLIVRAASLDSLARVVVNVVRRRPLRRDDVVRLTGASVHVEWSKVTAGQIDGDPIEAAGRFEHTVQPGALRVCR